MTWQMITRRQGGLVSRAQLVALGHSVGVIDGWVANGRFECTRAKSVYRAAGAPPTIETPSWYAVLASRSPLSFFSAADWWDVPIDGDGLLHISRFDRRRLDWPTGVRVHRVSLPTGAVTERLGLPVTNRVETILDCLGAVSPARAERLADRAVQQKWLCRNDVERRLEQSPGRWGNGNLKRLLPIIGDGAEAVSERRLHRVLRDAGIGGWSPNRWVRLQGGWFRIDVAFTAVKLAVEIDGMRYHAEDDRFQDDRTKQNALVRDGWTILRFTWSDITESPHDVVARILAQLATLGGSP